MANARWVPSAAARRADEGEVRTGMNRDKAFIMVMFLAVVGVAAGLHFLLRGGAGAGGGTIDPVGGAPVRPSSVGEFRGISLQLQSSHPQHPYKQYIDEIASTGANTINLVPAAYQENCSSTTLLVDARKAPSDERLLGLIEYAHGKGLRVVLMPVVLLENPRAGEWRGKISPEKANWKDWWEDYHNYILHYAQLAEKGKAEVFIIGSELISTESQVHRWRELIKLIRGMYTGRLSYSANWDHYWQVKWWDALDIVGMTTYYDLTEGDPPTLERLLDSWKGHREKILDWRKNINRPLLFTEVGWPNQETCAQYPWDYYRADTRPDEQAQANCFEAFFRTWKDCKESAGYLIWEWRNHPSQKIGPEDTSYVPNGKKAMQVIREYFQAPSPWATSKPLTIDNSIDD